MTTVKRSGRASRNVGNQELASFEKLLVSSLNRTIDFVRFAETKNAALLTFSSAWIIASINILTGPRELPSPIASAFTVALAFFAVAALISIESFLPKISLSHFHKPIDGSKSLIFFGNIAEIEITSFKNRLMERYASATNRSVSDHYLDDLAVQIAVNSRIAKRKFQSFNAAAALVFLAFAILATPPTISIVKKYILVDTITDQGGIPKQALLSLLFASRLLEPFSKTKRHFRLFALQYLFRSENLQAWKFHPAGFVETC